MASAPPPTSGLRLCGDASLRVVSPPQLPWGGLVDLRLPTKHDGYSFHMSEGIENPETRLAGVAAGTLRKYAKARPQQAPMTSFSDSYKRDSTLLHGLLVHGHLYNLSTAF
jgi:hypothetical protein